MNSVSDPASDHWGQLEFDAARATVGHEPQGCLK